MIIDLTYITKYLIWACLRSAYMPILKKMPSRLLIVKVLYANIILDNVYLRVL